ncbi:MAG: sugar phosphate nucleotidyltransferase [Candidatus Hodarchaeota archaeon]
MYAVILAGGKGARLRPYTMILPKPLMPIGEMPIMEVVLRQLRAAGFRKVTIAVGYLAELLQAVFGDGEKLRLKIQYSLEDKPLGTVGPLKIINDLPETFLVMNGDVLTNLDYRALVDFHKQQESIVTIATYKRKVQVGFGVLEVDEQGFLSRYIEKPTLNYTVSMGIYVVQRYALKYVPEGEHFDLPDLVRILIERDERVTSYPFNGYWLDIGRPDDYAMAIEEFEQRRQEFLSEE